LLSGNKNVSVHQLAATCEIAQGANKLLAANICYSLNLITMHMFKKCFVKYE